MAFEEIKKKGGEIGLVAGRSQREKRRSYKDLLREEEEIAAQVRKTSKNRPKLQTEQQWNYFNSWSVYNQTDHIFSSSLTQNLLINSDNGTVV
uniref:Uncharacterized protein n=1 Tax=Astyanax mexicanus TaxID=7994 RepID=A0A8B9GTH3_ASTMX